MRRLFPAGAAAACAALLAACMADVSAGEARDIANAKLTKYCGGHCGPTSWSHTEKLKDRWLVDFDAPTHKFTVIVENNGNTKVTTWDK